MTRYENIVRYARTDNMREIDSNLEEAGDLGYRLVSVVENNGFLIMFFTKEIDVSGFVRGGR